EKCRFPLRSQRIGVVARRDGPEIRRRLALFADCPKRSGWSRSHIIRHAGETAILGTVHPPPQAHITRAGPPLRRILKEICLPSSSRSPRALPPQEPDRS